MREGSGAQVGPRGPAEMDPRLRGVISHGEQGGRARNERTGGERSKWSMTERGGHLLGDGRSLLRILLRGQNPPPYPRPLKNKHPYTTQTPACTGLSCLASVQVNKEVKNNLSCNYYGIVVTWGP